MSPKALDLLCRRIFKETYGERVVEWLGVWRAEQERLARLERSVRAVCRRFDNDRQRNFARATEWLQPLGVEPWSGHVHDPEFIALPPIARELARAVATGRRVGKPGLGPNFVTSTKRGTEAAGRVIPDVSKAHGFLIWAFELAVCNGPGFRFLAAKRPVPANRRAGRRRDLRTKKSGPPLPLRLKTFELIWLPARSLTAIGRLLLPEQFGLSLIDEVAEAKHEFEALRRRTKQALETYGNARLATATARSPSAARQAEREKRWREEHPAGTRDTEFRLLMLGAFSEQTRGSLPAWLPWPGGYRDKDRDRAAVEREVVVFADELASGEIPTTMEPGLPVDQDKNMPPR
ncbi:MAG: hypothetical protein U0263_32655 [Polyangiaceae bacterium]